MAKTWDLSRKARQSGVFHQLRCRFPRFGIPRVAKSPSPASRVRADSPENRAIQAATGTRRRNRNNSGIAGRQSVAATGQMAPMKDGLVQRRSSFQSAAENGGEALSAGEDALQLALP